MHHSDPKSPGVDWAAQRLDLSVHRDVARVRLKHPCCDVHQRRLSGAILAEQRVDFAGAECEVYVAKGLDGPEPLGDSGELEEGRHQR